MKLNKFFNGRGLSKHSQEAFDSLIGADVHTDIGTVTGQVALATDATSGVPTEPCVQCSTPTGIQYLFSQTTGKIWKRTSAGVYSSMTANDYTTGHRGCQFFNGYMWFWTATKLGVFNATTEGERNNAHGTFANGGAYASCEENQTLFISDGKYIASVNSSNTFAPNALDLPPQFFGSCITPDGFTNILIGTIIGANIQVCRGFLWDTYSDSFTLSDEVPETGINCFINCDDVIMAQCGTNGKLYQWTGQTFAVWDNELRAETTTLGHQLSTVFNSRPLIAVGTKIYSIYRRGAGMPRVLVQEYTATNTIYSIDVVGSTLLVSVSNGVNKTGTNKATVTIDTPEIMGNFNQLSVDYTSLPTGTSISLYTNTNGAGFVAQTSIIDTINKKVYFDGGLLDCAFIQGRVILNPSTTLSPVISNIEIL